MDLLTVDQLSKSFGARRAVSDVSFSVAAGQVAAILGPNGAGKSTTLRMIAGYLEPDTGDALINGASIAMQRRQAQLSLGYLAEGAPLYLDLTVIGFLRFLAGAHGLGGRTARSAIARAIADSGVDTVMDQSIGALSKGYRRRVAIAGAILHDPPVLILDEPTDGLDPNQKVVMRDLVRRLAGDKAVLISTHQLDEVDAMCDRAIVIDRGRIVADSTPAQLAASAGGRLDAAFRRLTEAAADAQAGAAA